MKRIKMVAAIAEAVGTTKPSVTHTLRFLQAEGLLSLPAYDGPRGINSPDLTARDMATVLLPYLADKEPGRRALDIFNRFASLTCKSALDPQPFSLEALCGLKVPFTFIDGLAAVIEVLAFRMDSEAVQSVMRPEKWSDAKWPPRVSVSVSDSPFPEALIDMGPIDDLSTACYHFDRPSKLTLAEAREADRRFTRHIHRDGWVTQGFLMPLAAALRDGAA